MKMKQFQYVISLYLIFTVSLSYGQNETTRELERPELKLFKGIWEGSISTDTTLQLELSFKKVYYEKGNFLVDQLVGVGYLSSTGKESRKAVVEIIGVDLMKLNSSVLLKLKSFDKDKEKYIELVLELQNLEESSGELLVTNKETFVINGKVNGKKWDSGFSLPTTWNMTKIE